MARIAHNSAFDAVAQAVTIGLSLAAGIVLARLMGDEGRGVYVYATSFSGMLALGFANLGFELAASTLVGKDRRRLAEVHTALVLAAGLVAAVTLTLAAAFGEFLTTAVLPGLPVYAVWLLAAGLPFWVYQLGANGCLVGLGRVRARAGYELVLNTTQSALVLLLLFGTLGAAPEEVVPLLVAAFYATIAAGSVAQYRILRGRRRRRLWRLPSVATLRALLAYGGAVYTGNLGATLGQRVDQYFVQRVTVDPGAFGVYTLATALTARTRLFPQALTRATWRGLATGEGREAAFLTAASFRQMLALGLLLLVAGSAAAPLIPIVYTDAFAPAVIPFIIFLVGRLCQSPTWMLANFFSAHLSRPGIPMMVNWALLPAQAVAAYLAMSMGGLVAVALVAAASYALQLVVFLVLFLRFQDHVVLRDLFLLRGSDLRPWIEIARSTLRRLGLVPKPQNPK